MHTTELNLDEAGETLSAGNTVLYQRRHLEALAARLAALGHRMLPLDHAQGPGILDQFVDVPPYEEGRVPLGHLSPPHLRLSISGYPATSVAILAIAGRTGP